MADKTIPQRELRNNIAAILRAAEAGETFTVTVRGRPVARVVPPGDPTYPRVDVDRDTILRILSTPIDADFQRDLDEVEEPIDNPWPDDKPWSE
jgi:prevent-host-death family protein